MTTFIVEELYHIIPKQLRLSRTRIRAINRLDIGTPTPTKPHRIDFLATFNGRIREL